MTAETTNEQDEPTEQEEALYSAVAVTLEDITGHWREDDNARMLQALRDPIAAIVRQATAEALNTQAARLGAVNSQYIKRLKHYEYDSDAYKLTFARAGQASADAARLRNAARDIIAEGWEFTCYATWAATRDDPGYGCDAPVENEGDYCDRHEPEDDDRGDD